MSVLRNCTRLREKSVCRVKNKSVGIRFGGPISIYRRFDEPARCPELFRKRGEDGNPRFRHAGTIRRRCEDASRYVTHECTYCTYIRTVRSVVRAPTRTEEARSIIRPRSSPDEGCAASTPSWKRSSSKIARLRALSTIWRSHFAPKRAAIHSLTDRFTVRAAVMSVISGSRLLPAILLGPLSLSSGDSVCFPLGLTSSKDRVSRVTHHLLKTKAERSTPNAGRVAFVALRSTNVAPDLSRPATPVYLLRSVTAEEREDPQGCEVHYVALSRIYHDGSANAQINGDHDITTWPAREKTVESMQSRTAKPVPSDARGRGRGDFTVADVFVRNVR